MKAPKVVVGWHDTGITQGAFTASIASMALYAGRMFSNFIRIPGPYVAEARNQMVHDFLKTTGDYLLMIDADEEFPPDALYRTMAAYEISGADILYGNYALSDFSPSFFVLQEGVEIPQNLEHYVTLEPCKLYEIAAGATGWLFAHRSVFEKIASLHPDDPWKWFMHDIESTEGCTDISGKLLDINARLRLGEDITFCARAREAGCRIVGYTGILIVHHKTMPILCDFMKDYAKAAGLKV